MHSFIIVCRHNCDTFNNFTIELHYYRYSSINFSLVISILVFHRKKNDHCSFLNRRNVYSDETRKSITNSDPMLREFERKLAKIEPSYG